MLSFLRGPILGVVMALVLVVHTLIMAVPVYATILLKLLLPKGAARERVTQWMSALAQTWANNNVWLGDHLIGIRWDIRCPVPLTRRDQYLVCVNHQSWNDIHVLIKTFGRRAPFFKFFLKKELVWVPVLGPVWWGLDYPFMQRHSAETLMKYPELRGQDLEATRRACEAARNHPVLLLNFLEGTRFTPAKHARQKSRFSHLLKPKAGGLVFALQAMGERLDSLLDVTIVYPDGAKGFWAFLQGHVRYVVVEVRKLTVPPEFFHGDYMGDGEFRRRVQAWVQQIWEEKDRRIGELLAEARADDAPADDARAKA